MNDSTQPPIQDAAQLVEETELSGVRFRELSGTLNPDSRVTEGEPSYELTVERQLSDTHFGVVCTVNFQAPDAAYTVSVECSYLRRSVREIADAAMVEFIERVAIMTAYPFIRESLHDLSRRLGAGSVVLGLLRPGHIQLEPTEKLVAD